MSSWILVSSDLPTSIRGADILVRFVNMLIRSDVANKYHLRKKMHWTEMGVLIAALNGRHCDKKLGEKFLDAWRGKVAREDIYSSIRGMCCDLSFVRLVFT